MSQRTRILIQTPPASEQSSAGARTTGLHVIWLRYGVPVVSVCFAIGGMLVLSHITKEIRSSSIFFFAAIMVSTWFGRLSAGFLAIALSIISLDFFILRPIAAYGISVFDLPFILIFCLSAILISYLVDFRRRAEDKLRQRNNEIEARVAERTRELVEANKLKDQTMAIVSYDLRAPLTSILGWIEILEKNGNDRRTIYKALSVIKRSAERQSQMVRDLLDTTGIETNSLQLRMQPVDLVKLLQETEDHILPIAAEKEITLDFSCDEPSLLLQGDPYRLAQVIDNLLINAIQYTPKRGNVTVRLETTDTAARIVVSDTGKGIDAELLPYLFDKFRQGENETPGGLGLGLAIVKQIVEAHGGTVSAASPGDGKGSTFVVTLETERTVYGISDGTMLTARDGKPNVKVMSRDGIALTRANGET